ncbi:MAG TPA: FtsQ-type POTRA domain-containing protein [Polyangiaceae bacterium]|nr:FtsQ-type POTRA domain-containing protein [Polyangiaceae bacterium]
MSASKPPTPNRRIARQGKIIEAPADPMPGVLRGDDESPPPAPTSNTVRPPPGPNARVSSPRGPGKITRTLQLIFGAAVVIIASVAVAWGARRYIMSSPRFAIRTVLVEGASRRTAEQIASAGGVAVGANIFALDPEAVSIAITTDPWIERAAVVRKLPSTIQITVAEREARAAAAIGGDLYLATRDGELFKRFAPADPEDLPIVTGILPEQVARDRAGVVLAVKRALDVLEELERTGIAKRYPVQELHLEKDGSLVITIGKEAIALHLGHPPFRAKIEQGSRVLQEIGKRKANASVIFLDNDAHPERVVVRMR